LYDDIVYYSLKNSETVRQKMASIDLMEITTKPSLIKKDFLILICIFLAIGIFTYREYLLLNKIFIFAGFASDTIRQFFADDYFRSERLFSGNFSFWSFQHDLGMNVFALIANFNPFDILIILFGKEYLAYAIVYINLLKIIVAGILFFKFLKKIDISSDAAVIGALLFSFCGYMTLNGHWYHYLNYAVFASLMLFLCERWFQDGKWLLMVLAIGLACIKGVLQLYQFIFFLTLYGLFRIIYEKGLHFKEISIFFAKFYFLYGIGIGLGAFYILPELYQAMSSARGGESIHKFTLIQWIADALRLSDPMNIRTFLLRYLSNDIIGSFERFKGAGNYLEAPAAYSGLITLFAAPMVFLDKNRRHKIAFILLSCVSLLYFFFPYIRVIGNAFASGTYKHTIMYNSICLIIMASYFLNVLFRRKIDYSGYLFVSFAFFSGIWIIGWATKEIFIDNDVLYKVGAGFILYGVIFIAFQFPKLHLYAKYALFAVVVIELAVFARITVSRSSGALTSGFIERGERYFNKDTMQALNFIRTSDKSFYRVEKGYTSDYLNDAVVQNYYGTSAYYGFSATAVVDFHKSLRISPQSPRIASYRYGLSKRDKLQSLLNVKYFLSQHIEDKPFGFTHVRSFGNVHLFQNQNHMPLGFVYNHYIRRSDFETLPIETKESVILKSFVSNKEYDHLLRIDPIQQKTPETAGKSKDLHPEYFEISSFKEDHIKGYIHLNNDGILFFAIPFDKGWKAIVDGKEEKPELINIAFMGLPLMQGEHHIELKFIPPYLNLGIVISLICIMIIVCMFIKFPRIKGIDISSQV